MKIKNTRNINEKIMAYVEGRQYNSFIATAILLPINTNGVVFSDEKMISNVADHFLENAKRDGVEYTREEALMAAMLLALVRKHNVQGGQFPEALYDEITRNSRIFHRDSFAKEPFLRRIKWKDESTEHLHFAKQITQPYELFCYGASVRGDYGVTIPSLAAFDCKYSYPCIMEGEKIRLSLTPYQIFTTQEAIEKANGNVLILGLGMGYSAYMMHTKDSVSKVTVIEHDPEVIELFEKYTLPQFEHPEKVEVVCGDAFAYMETLEDGTYDFCFADLWENHLDLEVYFRLKKICKRFERMKMNYWIEEELISTLLGMVFVVILEAFYEHMGMAAPTPSGLSEAGSGYLAVLREALKNEEITRPDHVDWYMDPENIMKLI
ncbi:MAG: hypothetical protein IKO10_11285 [Lachnospiraceae bacterium]|nr:hypothetical protein [Lachnospiraceae bacterium]